MTTTELRPDQVPVTFAANDEQAQAALADLRDAVAIALDTETVIERDEDGNPLKRNLSVLADGEGPGPWRVLSLAARFADGTVRAYVIDMGYVAYHVIRDALTGLRPFMWNAPFDRLVLRRAGIDILAWDLMLGEAILRTGAGGGDGRHYTALAKASRRFLGYDIDGKKTTRLDYRTPEERPELSAEEIEYAAIDAVVTLMLGARIGDQLKIAGLTETFVRDCNGQPFIAGMENAGLPLLADDYRDVINAERLAMNEAEERIALATTGKEMLDTLAKWATATGRASGDLDTDAVLQLMHDPAVFGDFLDDIAAQVESSRERMGAVLGAKPVDDLFTDEQGATFVPLPFDPSNETEVRRWLTKNAPHFAAAWALAYREEGTFADLMSAPADEVAAKAGRRKALTKDHPLDDVLEALGTGSYSDVTVTGVSLELAAYRRYARILADYGHLRGGSESAWLVPTWDLSSAPQTKEMFNRFAPELVRAYFARTTGTERLFETADSVDGDTLKMVTGELAEAMLEYRKRMKIVSTYGDEMLKYVNDVTGRVHARYNQSLTGTGRLSSFYPNAQNLSPLVKPFVRPLTVDGIVTRVLVCADLSQAELRFVASAAGDVEMLSAFRSGEDLHTRTASLMFSVDLVELKKHEDKTLANLVGVVDGIEPYAAENPGTLAKLFYKTQRQKAKRVAFGYAYGLKGASLARGLTVEGVPTTKEEADELLRKFDEAYPQVAAWMAAREGYIRGLAEAMKDTDRHSGVDFARTWLLHLVHAKTHSAHTALSRTLERSPDDVELAVKLKPQLKVDADALEAGKAEMSAEEYAAKLAALEAEQARVASTARWALDHDHSVVLTPEGVPWEFESRTTGGRRRRFQVATKQLVLSVVTQVARSRRRELLELRDAWVESWNERKAAEHEAKREAGKARGEYKPLSLLKNGKVLESRELEKKFEDRDMQNDFVGFCLRFLPAGRMEQVWRLAMADRIRAMGNQYRNHPIQGGVADAVMDAFGDIYRDLSEQFPTAAGIQSVHDSIVVECDVADAAAVRDIVVKRMQDALARYCPQVPCVADGDIQLSLDDSTVITDDQLAELVAKAAEFTLVA